MKNYVDLHLHSIDSARNKDVIVWHSTFDALIKLRNKNISIFSFTDHDFFSFKLFTEVKTLIKKHNLDMKIFPGVELTIKRKNNSKGHILIIFNEDDDQELKELQLLIHNNSSPEGTNFDHFMNLIQNRYEFIIIPHVGKCDSIEYEDIQDFKHLVFNVESPSNKDALKIFQTKIGNQEINPIMFSDTHNWDNYKGSSVYIEGDLDFKNLKKNLKMEE